MGEDLPRKFEEQPLQTEDKETALRNILEEIAKPVIGSVDIQDWSQKVASAGDLDGLIGFFCRLEVKSHLIGSMVIFIDGF